MDEFLDKLEELNNIMESLQGRGVLSLKEASTIYINSEKLKEFFIKKIEDKELIKKQQVEEEKIKKRLIEIKEEEEEKEKEIKKQIEDKIPKPYEMKTGKLFYSFIEENCNVNIENPVSIWIESDISCCIKEKFKNTENNLLIDEEKDVETICSEIEKSEQKELDEFELI